MALLLFDDVYLKKCFEERLEVSDHIHALALRIVAAAAQLPLALCSTISPMTRRLGIFLLGYSCRSLVDR